MSEHFQQHASQDSTVAGTSQGTPDSVGSSAAALREFPLPNVFEFTNYREYLAKFVAAKRSTNPAYSSASFVRRAGLGANSRGYLKLVIDGKRNLTPNTIRAFSEALGLDPQASLYFENLVLFNQSEKAKDKKYYFERMISASPSKRSDQVELLESQLRWVSNWYFIPLRELVLLPEFQESGDWISKKLKNKISPQVAIEAIRDLVRLGLLKRDPATGRLLQSEPLIKVSGNVFSPFLVSMHQGLIERAKEALTEETFERRSASCLTFACQEEDIKKI
jgi:uncharacterized protein (TIGR02147 family)